MTAPQFRAGHGAGDSWSAAVKACVDSLLPVPDGAALGFVYVTDALADHLGSVLTFLRERTRIEHWVGTIGLGICGGGRDYFGQPAVSVLVAAWPDAAFRVFGPEEAGAGALAAAMDRPWFGGPRPAFGIVHGDPRDATLPSHLAELSAGAGLYFVGGVAASASGPPAQIADKIVEGGLSGVMLTPEIAVATGLTQGCTPIGPVRQVTSSRENIVMEIDNRLALDVFKEDIGELLARDLRRVAGRVFAAIPVRGSDTGDYLVRNLMAIDVERGWIGIADQLLAGDPILFCRRDPAAAASDMTRMLEGIKHRIPGTPKAGLYFSCVGRGPNLFEPDAEEVRMINQVLGEFPLAGFFGNGEIAHDRLYGYTGVLALFL